MDDESVAARSDRPLSPKPEAGGGSADDISLPLESEPDKSLADLADFEPSRRLVAAAKTLRGGLRSVVGVAVGGASARVEALVVATDARYEARFGPGDWAYAGFAAPDFEDRRLLARRVFDDVDLDGGELKLAPSAPAPARGDAPRPPRPATPEAPAPPRPDEDAASAKLQARYRGHKERTNPSEPAHVAERKDAASAKLQARYRGHQERTNPKPRPEKTAKAPAEAPAAEAPAAEAPAAEAPAAEAPAAEAPAAEAPAAEAPAAAPSPAKVTMRASIRLPESRGGGKMLVKLTRSGDGLRIQFLDTNMDSHHSQIIDEADLPDGLTDVMTRAHAEYLAEKFYVDCR